MWLTLELTRCVCSFEKVTFRRTPESATAAEEDATARPQLPRSSSRPATATPSGARTSPSPEGARSAARGTWRGSGPAPRGQLRTVRGSTGCPRVLKASFLLGGLDVAFPDETVSMARTGMYTLQFIHCDALLAGGQVASMVKTIWKNSRSYLSGHMAPLLPFYGAISLAFMALSAYWFT